MKESIPRHAREVTDNLIKSEEKSIQSIQAKLAETTQDISKMEKTIKALESKKSTMAVGLKFGESFTAQYRCQNLIEVEVKTDKGAWTFTLTDNRANMDNHNPTDREKKEQKSLPKSSKSCRALSTEWRKILWSARNGHSRSLWGFYPSK
ncbi:hypothetical protein HpBTM54_14100 [Helicobacter pylori]